MKSVVPLICSYNHYILVLGIVIKVLCVNECVCVRERRTFMSRFTLPIAYLHCTITWYFVYINNEVDIRPLNKSPKIRILSPCSIHDIHTYAP